MAKKSPIRTPTRNTSRTINRTNNTTISEQIVAQVGKKVVTEQIISNATKVQASNVEESPESKAYREEKERILNNLRDTFSNKITSFNPNDEGSKHLI